MKASLSLLKHTPLIKFVGGPHLHGMSLLFWFQKFKMRILTIPAAASGAVKPHPCSPTGKVPVLSQLASSFVSKPIVLKEGEVLLRSELSSRFRYTPLKAEEEDQITSGGAELVY